MNRRNQLADHVLVAMWALEQNDIQQTSETIRFALEETSSLSAKEVANLSDEIRARK